MSLRFLHTADWQIGMKAAHVGVIGPRVREVRLAAARRIVDLANERAVDALVLVGDTFEDSDVPRALVQQVADILRTCKAPVLILPGNHDPLVPGGVYEHPAWKTAEPGLRVLRNADPVEIAGAVFLPCPLTRRTSADDPTDVLPTFAGTRERIRIGLAHGSLRGAGVPDDQMADDFPIERSVVRRAQLDYLALGHWHVPSVHEVDDEVRVAYCGSHEPTKFGERSQSGTSGQCLLITIEAPGAPPALQEVRTAFLEWRQEDHDISRPDDLARLRAVIDGEAATSRERVLLDLKLSGSIAPGEMLALEDLAELAAQRFLFARVRGDGLLVRPASDGWVDELPPGVPREVAKRLLEGASTGEEAPAARAALDLLYRLSREAAR